MKSLKLGALLAAVAILNTGCIAMAVTGAAVTVAGAAVGGVVAVGSAAVSGVGAVGKGAYHLVAGKPDAPKPVN
jgi:hypothetical protein